MRGQVHGDTTTLPFYPVFRSGLNYKLAKATYLRMSFGQGYRFPSIAEKFVNTSVGSSLRLFPNPNVQPETGWSSEIGVKQGFKLGKWNGYLDIAGFWTEYSDMIEFAFGLYNPDTVQITLLNINDWLGFQAQNVGRAQIRGIDASLAGQGEIGKVGITLLAGYTYMYPLNLNTDSIYLLTKSDSTSNMLKYRFNHLAKADMQLDYKRWSLGWSMRYNSVMTSVDAIFEKPLIGNVYITPGVEEYRRQHNRGDIVFDARFACRVSEESKIAIISNNVLNREYMGRPADMQPPRTLAVQYTLSF
ncbi:MAG: TonB-dependent receptor plug domain-containing protein [Flavobacteriales bacterium]